MFTRKISLILALITFAMPGVYAQATVTSIMIEKENRNAVMIQIDHPVDLTTTALDERMKRSGLSGKTHNNVTSYKAITLPEIASEKVDIYTKIEKGQNNHTSIVYMAVSKWYNSSTHDEPDSMITGNIKAFLNSFVKDADGYALDLLITSQIAEVNSAEKEYANLLSDQKDLDKKKADNASNTVDKGKEIQQKKDELDRKKEALAELQRNRAGIN